MTLKILSRYYEMQKKLMLYQDTLGSLRAAAETMTPKLSDMPKTPNAQDKTAKFVAQIVDLENKIAKLKLDISCERHAVMEFLGLIQDGFIKTIFSLRFIECMTWMEIAEVVGGDNTEDSVKKICYRYLNARE